MASGQILVGCEGNDHSLPYLASQIGIEAFAYSSDYPHEVDLLDAQHEIRETLERQELTQAQKEAVLEQITRVLAGALRFMLDGAAVVVGAGETLHIPSNTEHSTEALEETDEIDAFSPIRTDWLDGSDAYHREDAQKR